MSDCILQVDYLALKDRTWRGSGSRRQGYCHRYHVNTQDSVCVPNPPVPSLPGAAQAPSHYKQPRKIVVSNPVNTLMANSPGTNNRQCGFCITEQGSRSDDSTTIHHWPSLPVLPGSLVSP